jgi:hypothetical protein
MAQDMLACVISLGGVEGNIMAKGITKTERVTIERDRKFNRLAEDLNRHVADLQGATRYFLRYCEQGGLYAHLIPKRIRGIAEQLTALAGEIEAFQGDDNQVRQPPSQL